MTALRRRPGPVSVADVGCAVWSSSRRRATPTDEIPVGGLVVAVTEQHNHDTSEIERAFSVFDHQTTRPRLHWSLLVESEVDATTIDRVDVGALKAACKHLADDVVHERGRRRHGQPGPREARSVRALATLMALIVGDDSRDGCQRHLDPVAVAAMWRHLVEPILDSKGPITLGLAQRVFAAEELVALVFGDGGVYGRPAELVDAAPAAPRPTAPVNVSGLVD